MTIKELCGIIEEIAPPENAWDKDNIGLIAGNPETEITCALVTLDISLDVIKEARLKGAQIILSHHPVIFGGADKITSRTATGRRVTALLQNDIASICLHTNYDGALGGINDELARVLGLEDVQILINRNGEYGRCGYLRAEKKVSAAEYAEIVRDTLKVSGLRYWDAGSPVNRVCVGSGGSGGLFERVIEAGCDTFVTGDVKHNVFCDARDMGLNLIDATHFSTEDIMCGLLIDRLKAIVPEFLVYKAETGRAPYLALD